MKLRLSPKGPIMFALACCCLFAGPSFLACMHKANRQSNLKKTIYLDAKSDWLDTGIWVREGEEVGLKCQGTWAVAPANESKRWPDTGPEGHGSHPGEKVHRRGDPKKELPGIPFGTLLARVGGIVFPIGNQEWVLMPSNGRLYLVINDYPFYRHDNRGGLTITILLEAKNRSGAVQPSDPAAFETSGSDDG